MRTSAVRDVPHDRLPYLEQEILRFIDVRLQLLGAVRRLDVMNRFGLPSASATRYLGIYVDERPNNVEYLSKRYVRKAGFEPLFPNILTSDEAFNWLIDKQGPGGGAAQLSAIRESQPIVVTLEVLATIARSAAQRRFSEIKYSTPHEHWSGLIQPHSFADVLGCRLFRAHVPVEKCFRTFVLDYVEQAEDRGSAPASAPQSEEDEEWLRVTRIRLVPHPKNVADPGALLRVVAPKRTHWDAEVPSGIAKQWLERMGVDTTEDHSLQGSHYRWWMLR